MPSSGGVPPADHSFGVFSPPGAAPRAGAVEGDAVLDLAGLAAAGLIDGLGGAFAAPVLNPFMALGPAAWAATRDALGAVRGDPRADAHRHRLDGVALHLPFAVADFADFYASSTTRRTSGGSCVPATSRCCRTGGGCPSATTAAPAPSW